MITPELRRLVYAASEHVRRWNDDGDHTVAAALLTKTGQTVLGLNTYHFLGGPCGEIAALSNHAATCPDDPVVAVVAAYGGSGDVIAPCGKCRQILFDINPAIQCVVRGANGLEAHTVEELLPFAYDWKVADQPQRIYMWEGYEGSIRQGKKNQTIRIDDPFRPGPAQLVFEKDNGSVFTLDAYVTQVQTSTRDALTEEHALADGFANLDELHQALEHHYPELGVEDPVDVVTFTLAD
ncbi:ASCH domain-containing protein [Nesterenkonia alkaliphila]|uniref:ASCH domain-containing protein n=1 Tax=Nesterenkonia alkaliphila TaxID=1463631 RepID=A0A7K1UFT0_9MICC|nr:ASCH domain-containing protein [Nesterenkonia alkaliphila]MVT25244.1 ASCH domain-containing protein [Nesterenkonia alkaliphila]GFZ91395.1 hypothetical protein GCM10011359_20900 [Nesterenkonia alkaliphila]